MDDRILHDPHLEIIPDHAGPHYDALRVVLTQNGMEPDEAILTLDNSWNQNHAARVLAWDPQVENDAAAAVLAQQQQVQQQQVPDQQAPAALPVPGSSLLSPTYSARSPSGVRAVRADSSDFTRTSLGIFLAELLAKFPFRVRVWSELSLSSVRAEMLGLGIPN